MKTAKSFAREIAQRYQGRVKRREFETYGIPRCEVSVDGTHHGRPLRFWVFEDGCLVEGATRLKVPLAVSFNSTFARIDVPDLKALPKGAIPVFRARMFKGGREITPETLPALRSILETLWADQPTRQQLLALQLTKGEFLTLAEHPLFADGPPAFYFLHRSPDLQQLERRLDILFELLPAVPSEAIEARRINDTAFGIKVARGAKGGTGSPNHSFGGTLPSAPDCPNCNTPIHLILSIDTTDPALRVGAVGRKQFPVLYCLNCMSWGTLYVDYAGKQLRVIRQDKAEKVNDDSPIEERGVSLSPLTSPKTSASKVGGSPKWLQGPAVPDCVTCKEPMTFFAQLKSLPTLSFGDEGMLYSFACLDCKVSATLIQSH